MKLLDIGRFTHVTEDGRPLSLYLAGNIENEHPGFVKGEVEGCVPIPMVSYQDPYDNAYEIDTVSTCANTSLHCTPLKVAIVELTEEELAAIERGELDLILRTGANRGRKEHNNDSTQQ